jgi:hypothetical protein
LVVWAIPLIYFYRSFRREGSHLDPRNSDAMAELPGLSK